MFEGVGSGTLYVEECGELTLRFSNTFSFVTAKLVRYRVRLTYPDAETSPERRLQITEQLQAARAELTVSQQVEWY